MQHAGLQYGQGAANSHQSPPFVPEDQSQSGGGNTTSTLRQFRKRELLADGKQQQANGGDEQIQETSHIARVAPHNYHHPVARSNDYLRYPVHQYADFSAPYKDGGALHHQVKYSEIAESTQNLQHKDKDFMEMCNITQQGAAHVKQPYTGEGVRQQTYSDAVHHQYLHKEPPQVHHPGYKPESHQYQQYPHQLAKYNMAPSNQCRKFAPPPPPPPENDFLAKLQRINPLMARSIMSDHHVLEAQSSYPKLPPPPSPSNDQQNRLYHQTQHHQRYYAAQGNNYNYPPHPHPHHQVYNYNYGRVGNAGNHLPPPPPPPPNGANVVRYQGNDRSLSPPRRGYQATAHDAMINNYNQKLTGYNQYQYAQHYQHRRDANSSAVPPIQDYYQQNCGSRSGQYLNQVDSPESGDSARVNNASSAIRHYLENWAEEEAQSEIGVDAGGQVFVINSDLSPEGLENLALISNEHGQYVLKNGTNENPPPNVVRIVEKEENCVDVALNERGVDVQVVEGPPPQETSVKGDWSGGVSQSDGADCDDSKNVTTTRSDLNNKEEPSGGDKEKVPPPEGGEGEGDVGDGFRDPNRTPTPGEDENRVACSERKVETTVKTEDGALVAKTMEIHEKQIDENRASFGFKVTEEVEVDESDFLTKDMPFIDEDKDETNKEDVAMTTKRTQRIFSVDDIINNIGPSSSGNQSRRSSLQSTKDFAISTGNSSSEIQPKIPQDPAGGEEDEDTQKSDQDKVEDEVQDSEEVRNAISIDVDNVIIEMGGVFFQLSINQFNGSKVLSVLPLSDSLIVDVNGNYANGETETTNEETKEDDDKEPVKSDDPEAASTNLEIPTEENEVVEEKIEEVEEAIEVNQDEEQEVASVVVAADDDLVLNEVTLGDDLAQEETIPLEEAESNLAQEAEISEIEVSNNVTEESEKALEPHIPEETVEVEEQKPVPEEKIDEPVVEEIEKPETPKPVIEEIEKVEIPKDVEKVESKVDENLVPDAAEDAPEIDLDLPQLQDDDDNDDVVLAKPLRKLKKKAHKKSPRKSIDEPINTVKKPEEIADNHNRKEIFSDDKTVDIGKKDEVASVMKTRSGGKKHQIIDFSKPHKDIDCKRESIDDDRSTKSCSRVKIPKTDEFKSLSKNKAQSLVDMKPKLVLKKIDDHIMVKSHQKPKKCEEINSKKLEVFNNIKSPSFEKHSMEEKRKKLPSTNVSKPEDLSKSVTKTIISRRASDSSCKTVTSSPLPTATVTRSPVEERVLFTKAAKKLFPEDPPTTPAKKIKMADQPPPISNVTRHGNNKINKNRNKRKLEDALNKIKSLKEKQNQAKNKKIVPISNISTNNNNNNSSVDDREESNISRPLLPTPAALPEPTKAPIPDNKTIKKLRIPKRVTFESRSSKDCNSSDENKKKLSWEEYSSRKRKHPSFSEDSTSSPTPPIGNVTKDDVTCQTPVEPQSSVDEIDVLEKVEMSIEHEIITKMKEKPPSPPPVETSIRTVILNAKNDWEDDDDDYVTSSDVKMATPPKMAPVKPIIDINDFNIKPIEATSPVAHFSEDDSLQVYKEVVDSKLNSLSIQIPKQQSAVAQRAPKSPDSRNVAFLIKRFLTKGTLNREELEQMRKIIEYKRMIEEDRVRSTYEVDRNDIKLHFRKVTSSATVADEPVTSPRSSSALLGKGGKRKRKRFRNLYALSSGEDDECRRRQGDGTGRQGDGCEGESDSGEDRNNNVDEDNDDVFGAKLCDYSVYQQNNNNSQAGVPKLIIKRKSGSIMPQPFVKLERSQAVDMMAKKRKFY